MYKCTCVYVFECVCATQHMPTVYIPDAKPNGQVQGFFVLETDITELHVLHERMRSKNEELKGFAYTVSHDLKAPLRGISGYAQELMRKHQDSLSERGQFCVDQIIHASKNLDQLIDDLLKYSRLDSETPVARPVQLDALIQSILRDRSHTLAELGVVLSLQVAPQVLTVWERGLHQVLSNLFDNAIKYSQHAAPPTLTIKAEYANDFCQLSVEDNGIGFDMKYHDRIFEMFQRLHRQEDFEGTGVGLATVERIVDTPFEKSDHVVMNVRESDFTTTTAIVNAQGGAVVVYAQHARGVVGYRHEDSASLSAAT